MPNLLVFIEQREGRVLPASYQVLAAATKLAAAHGEQAEACIVGSSIGGLTSAVAARGAKKIYTVDDAALRYYRTLPYTTAVCQVIDTAKPRAVLFPTSFMGRDLAPRVAARKRAGLVVDCTDLSYSNAELVATKSMYAGKTNAAFRLSGETLQVVTVRPNAFNALPEQSGAAAPVQAIPLQLRDTDQRLTVKEVVSTSAGVKDVTEADIVVSGGRSLKSKENFKIIYDLAAALDGAVGASRAACDAGYQPHSRQVGLTGKVISPALYIACGIDGAIQHIAGMRGSKVIVAINTKKDAPIFKLATYGCVADLFTLVPLITEEVKRIKHHA